MQNDTDSVPCGLRAKWTIQLAGEEQVFSYVCDAHKEGFNYFIPTPVISRFEGNTRCDGFMHPAPLHRTEICINPARFELTAKRIGTPWYRCADHLHLDNPPGYTYVHISKNSKEICGYTLPLRQEISPMVTTYCNKLANHEIIFYDQRPIEYRCKDHFITAYVGDPHVKSINSRYQFSDNTDHSCTYILKDAFVLQEDKPSIKSVGIARMLELLNEMRTIAIAKNSDYADTRKDAWQNFRQCELAGIPTYLGVITRLSDKYSRIMNLTRKLQINEAVAVSDESIYDTLLDLANYSIIAYCLLEETNGKLPDWARKHAEKILTEIDENSEEFRRYFRYIETKAGGILKDSQDSQLILLDTANIPLSRSGEK